ncbi:MAG TPA: RidA family protein [Anaerolineales bacterium]|nr:RidA family protein [Anaerolineales bacterium]
MDIDQHPEIEFYPADSMKGVPFSTAVRVEGMLYLSGQIGTDEAGNVVPGGIAAETRQAMENIRATLERYGSSLDRVVKATVMLADMKEWAEMNQVYVTYFDKHLPARSSFGTTGLALGARVEIECIAVLD